jgi:hypothetical protein
MPDGPQFDVDGARKAGYSDDEILQHLTTSRAFDVDGATKAGYSKAEIIQHLSTTPKPALIPGAPGGLPQEPKNKLGAVVPPTNVQPSNLGTIATGAPLMSMQPGLPSAAQVPENAQRMSEGAMIGAPIGGLITGGAAAIPAIGRSLLGAAGGSALGGWGGRELGGLVGHPDTGAQIGATLGGLAGGYKAARGGEIPTKGSFFQKVFGIGESATENPVAAAVKDRTAMWIPNRIKPPQPPPPELGSPENPGPYVKLPMRIPKVKAPEVQSNPFSGATSSASPGGENQQLPTFFQKALAQPNVSMVSKFEQPAPETPSRIIRPDAPMKSVQGSYWSFAESQLREAVLSGDRDAAIIYRQRFGQLPAGASYLTDVGAAPQRGLYKSR